MAQAKTKYGLGWTLQQLNYEQTRLKDREHRRDNNLKTLKLTYGSDGYNGNTENWHQLTSSLTSLLTTYGDMQYNYEGT